MSVPVVVYTGPACPYCTAAKQLLEKKGAAYQEVRIDESAEAMAAMLAASGGARSVPQIVIGTTHVGGFDELSALATAGGLDGLLAGESS